MNENAVKNLATRESKFAMTAGIYHWDSPQMYEWADVTKIGVNAPSVPMMGSARNWWPPASRSLEKRLKSGILTAMDEKSPIMTLRPVSAEYAVPMYVDVMCTLPVTSGPPP